MTESLLRLVDGRLLSFAQLGDPAGTPLFFFHGIPGARNVLRPEDPAALENRIRIIVPERPGYGRSSPAPGRTLSSWASDVAALADHLGIERFAVSGASGGGPYAAACAYHLPHRVRVAALISTSGEFLGRGDLRRLGIVNRLKFALPRWAPRLVRMDLAMAAPLLRWRAESASRLMAQRSRTDREASRSSDFQQRAASLIREAFRQGGEGTFTDLRLGSMPWGFDVRQISVPVHLWHGTEDQMAPPWMAERLASRIPGAQIHWVGGAGHLVLGHPGVWPSVLQTVGPMQSGEA